MAKIKEKNPSGSGRSAVPPQFLNLDWLNVFIEHREAISNITTNSNNENSVEETLVFHQSGEEEMLVAEEGTTIIQY